MAFGFITEETANSITLDPDRLTVDLQLVFFIERIHGSVWLIKAEAQ